MTFNIEVRGDQLIGERKLENKEESVNPSEWRVMWEDDMYGDLTYTVRGPTFDFTFEGYGLANEDYSLIYYPDPWPGTDLIVLDSGTASGGTLSLSGSLDCGSLPQAGDLNIPGAKIWLILSDDLNVAEDAMDAWNGDSYLFDTGLIEYTKAPAP